MLFALLYLALRRLIGLLLPSRTDACSAEAELLVLRHELRVLRRQVRRPRYRRRDPRELLRPTLVAPETLADATSVHFPDLAGIVPGLGKFDPNPWGLTFEVRGDKRPHWTGERNSPRTFGHFGGAGTFLWVDPDARLAVVALTDLEFGPWALEAWPPFSDAVLERHPNGD